MKKSKGIVVLLLTLILTVFFCFTAAVGIGPTGTGAAKHINTGLDLAGGVSITYQAKESNPTSEEMSDTIYKLQKRVEQYSTEAQVYQEGSDRITVEIPGVTDAYLFYFPGQNRQTFSDARYTSGHHPNRKARSTLIQ